MTLKELLAKLGEGQTALAALQAKATSAEATEADITALNEKLAEVEAIEKKIDTLKKVDAALARKAAPVTQPAGQVVEPKVHAQPAVKMTPSDKIGAVMVAMVKSYVDDGDKSNRNVLNKLDEAGYGEFASDLSIQQKTMNTLTGSAGGFAVPPDFRQEILPLLMPYTAFLRGGPTIVEMPNGNFRQSAGATRPTFGYKAENTDTPNSTATLRDIDMSAKILTGLIPITKQVARWTAGRAQTYATQTLVEAAGLALDDFMLRGNGTGPNPRGIFNIVGIGTRAAAAGVAPTRTVVDAALRQCINPVAQFAELQPGLAWVMPRRIIGYLEDMPTPGGEGYAYPSMQGPNKTLKGYPVLESAAIPVNLGAGTNEGIIGLVSFPKVLMGETQGMTLQISEDASYVTGGVTISAFQRDLVLIKANMEHDVEAQYAEAVQTLTAVQWGA